MIVRINDLEKIREANKNKKIVVAIGSFDLFHYEHLRFLKDAKKLGDILVVIVKDDFLVKFKSEDRPIINEEQRVAIIDNLKFVDYVVVATKENYIYNQQTLKVDCDDLNFKWLCSFYTIFQQLNPDILYHENTKQYNFARNYITQFGTLLVSRERTAIISTTQIINKIKSLK